MAAGRMPSTPRNSPVSPSSPWNSHPPSESRGTWPLAARIPRAMARSKRPPSLGRSAGARFTVIARAGNSNCELRIAARTRSFASRTAVAGSPTIDIRGRPPASCTSTCTAGALTPARARPCTSARVMAVRSAGRIAVATSAAGRLPGFQARERALQRLDLLAGLPQHRALDLELLAGHQVQPRQARLEDRLEVLLQCVAALAQSGRHQAAEAAGEVVDGGEVDHGRSASEERVPVCDASWIDGVGDHGGVPSELAARYPAGST